MTNLRIRINNFFDNSRLYCIGIQIFVLSSIVVFSIQTVPDLSTLEYNILDWLELLITIVFTIEYVLRILVSKRRLSYVISLEGFIDIIAILPYYLAGNSGFQVLRILRIYKIFKLSKRINAASLRIKKALLIAREELIIFSLCMILLLYGSAVGIYYFEHIAQPAIFKSIFHSLWWAVVTLTTVGYGDAYPVTFGGQAFTFIILMLGLCIVAIPSGIFASALSTVRSEESNG